MFYDLNVTWTSASDPSLPQTLAFLSELGYNVVALNHTITTIPTVPACPIPSPLPFAVPRNLTVLRRCTLILTSPASNSRLAALGAAYDILALRPVDEKTFSAVASNLECDLISLDLSSRQSYFPKFKTCAEALSRGLRIELCYTQALHGDNAARRNLISNAGSMIRATRGGRGLVLSSEAKGAIGCRGPWDVVNLAVIWGMKQDLAYEGVSQTAASVVRMAGLRRTAWRGVVDVVYGGDDQIEAEKKQASSGTTAGENTSKVVQVGRKRKAESADTALAVKPDGANGSDDKPPSKREQKRRAKKAREQMLGDPPAT